MTASLTVTCKIHLPSTRTSKRKVVVAGEAPPPAPAGRVPHVARLMALAIRFDGLLQRGEVRGYAELARLGHVTRARVTQIMNLLNLAPDIQEVLLHLPLVHGGDDPIKEWQMRPIAAEPRWERQRRLWRAT